jgi:hypothetical protein
MSAVDGALRQPHSLRCARLQIPHSKYVKGRHRPIDALALAFVAVALSLPALIAATMLGSKLNLDW